MQAITADGVRLSIRRHAAASDRRAVLLCTHAMMANGNYFERGFAQHLASRGIAVYVLDWRGHGASRPPHPQRDRWAFEDYVERDLPAAVDAVAADAGVDPEDLVYLGHSLGGLVGLAGFSTRTARRPRRISLWATSLWLPGPKLPALVSCRTGDERAVDPVPIAPDGGSTVAPQLLVRALLVECGPATRPLPGPALLGSVRPRP